MHIATHGLYRADTPAFSYLELADGRLEAFDIARLELNAAAVVLSACETGVGRLTGNELMGLARGVPPCRHAVGAGDALGGGRRRSWLT